MNLKNSIIDKKSTTMINLPFKEKINISALKHLMFEEFGNKYVVSLVDAEGFEILKGYGKTIEDAINDLHQNLL